MDVLNLASYIAARWWLSLLVVFGLLVIGIPAWRLTFHPLARFPGPAFWAVTRLPWHTAMHKGHLHHKILEHHIKYGPIVRIAPDELSIVHEDAFRDVYTNKNFEKNRVWFKPRKGAMKGQSIMTFEEDEHARLRRAFMGAFSENGVTQMSPVVERNANLLIKQLCEQSKQSERSPALDLVAWVNYTTFDIVGELAFGEPFGSLDLGKAHPWVAINLAFGRGVALNISVSYLSPLDNLMAFIVPKRVREMFVYHQQLSTSQVEKRLSMNEEKPDFLGSALKYNQGAIEKGDDHKIITRNEMYQNMAIFVFAGSETSASTLAATLRYVLQHPTVKRKLEREILDACKDLDDVNYANCNKLAYLAAVLNESMRLGAPTPIAVPRVAMARTFVCGEWIPKGAHVSVNQFAAYRSPHNFADPNTFQPERFLKQEDSSLDRLEAFQPFNIGRHQCIGYRMAWCVLKVILAKLIFSFDMELDDPVSVKDFGSQQAFLVWEKEPLRVRIRERVN